MSVNHRKVFRDDVEESRDTCYVSYHPADLRWDFAHLQLSFLGEYSESDVASLMEKECEYWLSKFCVPIKASSFDVAGS